MDLSAPHGRAIVDLNGGAMGQKSEYPPPPVRRLRVYAFDPQASTTTATAGINVATIKLASEQSWEENLRPGPINDYLEVIDIDRSAGNFTIQSISTTRTFWRRMASPRGFIRWFSIDPSNAQRDREVRECGDKTATASGFIASL
ncbi:hypothetical protein MESS4_330159 [Mesorhizobium sp. STM 4661]|nr:hypothetical protein MESS4_330159 [Mesorhizobium sp. STM 4661]